MTLRQQWAVVGGVVLLLGIVLGVAISGMRDEVFPVAVGARAPQFHARQLPDGVPKTLADYKGKVVLLNVWATWCAPCKAEMPDIEQLYRAYGPSGLKVVAVSVDAGVQDSTVTAFTRSLGLTFDILRDSTHAIERDYQVTGYPETFVIDDVGVIRKKWIGQYAWGSPEARSLISNLLGLGTPIPVSDSTGAHGGDSRPRRNP